MVCVLNIDRAYPRNKVIRRLPEDYPQDALDLFELTHTGKYEYTISEEKALAICSSFPSAIVATTIYEKASSCDDFRPVPCILQFYVDHVVNEVIDIICCELYAVYGDLKCNLFSLLEIIFSLLENEDILNRDNNRRPSAACLESIFFLMWERSSFYRRRGERMRNHL